MKQELGIAYCGLACCLCSEAETCPGCQEAGCPGHEACHNYNCCKAKGLAGCWECPEFPCGQGMHKNLRIRTFARFIKERGQPFLMECLADNERDGVRYHCPGGLVGDYDLENEDEIVSMLLRGKSRREGDAK